MVIAYTEKITKLSIATDSAWTSYDIFTTDGVPKGAVCEIICLNITVGSEVTMGLRKKGSGLSRALAIHEAEAGANVYGTTMRMLVQTDSGDGTIEYYTDDAVYSEFWLVGYWTGVNYNELWTQLTFAKTDLNTWIDKDLFTSDSVPKGSVCHVTGANNNTASFYSTVGVRTNGSGLSRQYPLEEAEGGGYATNSFFVKTNTSDGIIECYNVNYGTVSYFVDGYFDSGMDFHEDIQDVGALTTGAWTDWDLTAFLDVDGRVVDMVVGNTADAANMVAGIRGNGSGLSRTINLNEAEGTGAENAPMSAQSDAGGVVEYWASQNDGYVKYMGYFFPAGAPPARTLTTVKRVESRFRRCTSKFHSGTTQYRRYTTAG